MEAKYESRVGKKIRTDTAKTIRQGITRENYRFGGQTDQEKISV